MRIYTDAEVVSQTTTPAIDYNVSLAHGLSEDEHGTYPWQSERFGHTHDMGWYNLYQIPFEKQVKVTMTCSVDTPFWFRLGGVENYPIAVGNLELPSNAKLQIHRFDESVPVGTLVTLANVSGSAGLLTQLNVWIRSSEAYQEGCIQATIDGGRKLWMSSGLEDYFLGSYFHTMPQMSLGVTGFHLNNSTVCPSKHNGPNSLAAYRIHTQDPVLFSNSLQYQWQATGNDVEGKTLCNYQWPPKDEVKAAFAESTHGEVGTVAITTYAWVYVYS
jgi:hypothetical protein